MTSETGSDAVPARVIIEVALNGMTLRTRQPHVPRTPAEIAADGLRCMEAGAAIVHSHTDDPVLGGSGIHSAAPYLDAWKAVLRKRPDAQGQATLGETPKKFSAINSCLLDCNL